MGQSLSQLYVHLTFGTKGRFPFLSERIQPNLNAYVAGTLKNHESPALKINCVYDHILFRLSKNWALAKVVEEVKKTSSKWLKDEGIKDIKWQIGYGAFSVSSSIVNVVSKYIENRHVHHKTQDYKDEIEEFLYKYDIIEYDENYFRE